MRIESFQSLCELKAIKFIETKNYDLKELDVKKTIEDLADVLADKQEDYGFYFDIAQTAIKAVFSAPERYKRLLKSKKSEAVNLDPAMES